MVDVRIGGDVKKVKTSTQLVFGYKTSKFDQFKQEIMGKDQITPHKLYFILYLDENNKKTPTQLLNDFTSIIKTCLVLVKGLVKGAGDVIKAIEVSHKLLDDKRILTIIEVKDADIRDRINSFLQVVTKSEPDSVEEATSVTLKANFTPLDFLTCNINYSEPCFDFRVVGDVKREQLEFLQSLDLPNEIQLYLTQIQLFLYAKSAKFHILTKSSTILDYYSQFLQNIIPQNKIKLPKMPIINKILSIGREILDAKAEIYYYPDPFVYGVEFHTSDIIKLIDHLFIVQ